MPDDLTLALELCGMADAITLGRFRAVDLRVETKPDMTPVSEADRAVETALRARLASVRPGDAVLGEEQGATGGSARRRWIIDPIDGTRGYVRGLPVYATLLALEVDGEIVVGVASAPALHRRWWAAKGEGAHTPAGRIHVSRVHRVEDASISTTNPRDLTRPGQRHAYGALAARCWQSRALGDFWSHVLVAEGVVDIAVEPLAAVWDLAPLRLIVEEAGGRFTDLDGNPRIDSGHALSTNGLLHDEVLDLLTPNT